MFFSFLVLIKTLRDILFTIEQKKRSSLISLQPILFTIGFFLTTLAGMMVIPAVTDWWVGNYNWLGFSISALITGFVGLLMTFSNRPSGKVILSVRETFLLTAVTWVSVSLFAALPFMLSNSTISHTDSFFEAISGLTTTGATVIQGLDFASHGVLLWRSLLEWFGGIGIIVMAFTVMPLLKIGGMQLFRSEFSDRSEKVMPRVSQIATAIVITYVLLTILCGLLLYLAGMNLLEAVCHGLTTLATGGFSTSDTSIAYFNSPLIEWIIMAFMLIGAITFVLFIKMFQGRYRAVLDDHQALTFLKVVGGGVILMTLWRMHDQIPMMQAFRESAFSVLSIITTTGFTTADYTFWGMFPLMFFFILMMVGGCTGSSSGSIKILRYQIIFAVALSHIRQIRRPHGVFPPTYNGAVIPDAVSISVFTFFALYILSFAVLVLGLGMFDLDMSTTISGAASALNNIGPGFGPVIGPSGNFSTLPDGAKILLMIGMILGRLEYITFLILFLPSFWRN